MYRLYQQFAHRYDLHTPPGHYQHDHAYVIGEALRTAPAGCRLLDIGCGTGVFLEAALAAGIDAHGADAAPEMVEVARVRAGPRRVRIERMQDLAEHGAYDLVCALSWTIHYCETEAELHEVVRRCRAALKPGGLLLLQVANDHRMSGTVNVDREPGPRGELDDTLFIHQFQALHDAEDGALANYVYVSVAHRELLSEQHHLRFANCERITQVMRDVGLQQVAVVDPDSISPFVRGRAE